MTLGERIRAERKKRGWTQEQLARKVGLRTGSSVSQWETGNTEPEPPHRLILARLFGIPLDNLFEHSKEGGDAAGKASASATALQNLFGELDPQDAEVVLLLAQQLRARKKSRPQ